MNAAAFVQAEPLTRLIAMERPTLTSGVPSIWNEILQYCLHHEIDLSSLRMGNSGGSAAPRGMLERFEERYGVRMSRAGG